MKDECNITDKFADHFVEKNKTNRDSLKHYKNYNIKKELSEEEMKKFINQLKIIYSKLDTLATKNLKLYLHELLSSITKLVNLFHGLLNPNYERSVRSESLKF